MPKKICIFTGKRGGFGAMLGIMHRIEDDPDMELQVVASDMHLNETFGSTLTEVERRISVDAVVDLGNYGSDLIDRTQALGRCISGFAEVLSNLKPDIVLLLGDRGETLAAAFCAVEMGIVVAHIQAGDISGGMDDIHRHSITKLCHLHFSQNENQRQRVIRLGESEDRVWNTGAPYIDNILQAKYPPAQEALETIGVPSTEPYFLVLQHSDTYRPELAYDHTRMILETMAERPEQKVIVYPCSDPGYAGVIKALEEFKGREGFHFFKSIEALVFLGLMSGAKALVGNSSGGIIEAPYFRLPFVLVGDRQDGREAAANVYKVSDPSKQAIHDAIETVGSAGFVASMEADARPFGDGNACERIFDVLKATPVTPELYRKRICY